ncbi:MAG TPA: hypothetical protein PKD80_04275 [Microthrixaceae bacterium]|nr:hypothetical protein [Microthrixaceae bacterium]HMT62266.1 hypothetical protein [Microthrixaceae bacterium]
MAGAQVIVDPSEHESFQSIVERSATCAGMSPQFYAHTHGLPGVSLSAGPDVVRGFLGAVGLSTRGVHSPVELAGGPLRAVPRGARGVRWHGMTMPNHRHCPACLADGAGFSLMTKLRLVPVCPTHRVMIRDRCWSCGLPPAPAAAGTFGRLSGRSGFNHRYCNGSTGRVRCLADLGSGPLVAAPVAAIAARRVVEMAARYAAGDRLVGDWFGEVGGLAAAVLAVASPEDLDGFADGEPLEAFARHVSQRMSDGRGGVSYWRTDQASPLIVAAVLGLAVDVADRQRWDWFAEWCVRRSANDRQKAGWLRSAEWLPPSRRDEWVSHLSVREPRLSGKLKLCSRRRTALAAVPVRLGASRSPLFDGLLSGRATNIAVFEAMTVARVANRCSWSEAGGFVGIPGPVAIAAANRCVARLKKSGGLDRWSEAAVVTASDPRMVESGEVIAARRKWLRVTETVPGDVWERAFAGRPSRVRWPVRRQYALAWLWEVWADSDPRWSPAVLRLVDGGAVREHALERFRSFRVEVSGSPTVAGALLEWADAGLAVGVAA